MPIQLLTVAPTVAFSLAVVATVAYVLGKRATRFDFDFASGRRESKRAKSVIRELEIISRNVRQSLATHHASILQFKERVAELGQSQDEAAWKELSDVAEQMLKPTNRLSTQIAHAYDEIRQQANLLMSFTESRTDSLTGLSNRQAMEETLQSMFALYTRYRTGFAVAILDIDRFKAINQEHGHHYGDQLLRDFAQLLEESVRETDIVARFGGEEFLVVMPETDLAGACVFTDRYRARVSDKLPMTVSAGVAAPLGDDCVQSLLKRADTALYSAKSAGRDCVFRHSGDQIELVHTQPTLEPSLPSDTPQASKGDKAEPARQEATVDGLNTSACV